MKKFLKITGIIIAVIVVIGILSDSKTTKNTGSSNENKTATAEAKPTVKPAQTTPAPTLKPISPTKEPSKAPVVQKQATPTPKPTTTVATVEEFPKKLENYLNDNWDEMPETSYKVYWWDTWEGVNSGNTDLVVEPSFEPTKEQCQRIAQVATVSRVNWLGKKEGVIHVVKYDNSEDYCTLRTP